MTINTLVTDQHTAERLAKTQPGHANAQDGKLEIMPRSD
jgi:hypothetical protein